MSLDRRIREGLRGSAPSPEPEIAPALEHSLRRSRRLRTNRRLSAIAILAASLLLVAVIGPRMLDIIRSQRARPAEPPAPTSIVGTYAVDLTDSTDPSLLQGDLQGAWRFALQGDGLVIVQVPAESTVLPGRLTYQYSVDGMEFITNLFANDLCAGQASGRYIWRRLQGSVVFTLVDDGCGIRATILTSGPWSSV